MKWELAIIAATVLAVAGVSRRLTGTPVTPAMVFVLIGVLVGPLVIDEVTGAPAGSAVRTLAEATLAVVLSRTRPGSSLACSDTSMPFRCACSESGCR